MSESNEVQKPILDYLSKIGTYSFKTIQTNKSGTHDIVACVPFTKDEILKLFEKQDKVGVFVSLECKLPSNNPSKLQTRVMKQVIHAGGLSLDKVTSVDEVKKLLNKG